ncbi:MAG: hypothetical protein K1X94_12705 [Sandaracinaceae bacterium]|nr:hypothetical protein [Sandaracinaceae bacterium]
MLAMKEPVRVVCVRASLAVLLGCTRASLAVLLAALWIAGCGGDAPPPGDDAGVPVVGTACGPGQACGPGLTCLTDFPGGYCTSLCEGAACVAGAICDRGISPALCTDACATRADCREGYQCWRGGCVPACTDGPSCGMEGASCEGGQCVGAECTDPSMCPPGWSCLAGICTEVPDGGPVLLGLGAACTMDAECSSGICLPPERGGICSIGCVDALSCTSTTPFSAACGPVTHAGAVGTFCIPYRGSGALNGDPCTTNEECQSSTCLVGTCTEACNEPRDCTLGLECGDMPYEAGSFSGCHFPGGNPYEVVLPDLTLMAGFGNSLQRVALPPDVGSITLGCAHVSGDPLAMAFNQVTQTSFGATVTHFDLTGLYDWIDQPNRWIPQDGYELITMGLPGSTSDRVSLRRSSVRFNVLVFQRMDGDTGSATVRPSVLVRRGSDPATGAIEVAVHLVGVGVTAAAAPSDSRVQALLGRMDEVLAAVGIRRASTSYHDVASSTLSTIDSADGPDSELAQLFRLSAGRSGRVLSLFLVRTIEAGRSGFNTLGIAGGIPGPVGVHGTMHSGVAIAFDASVAGPSGRLAGQVAAHESGHYLGLFHVTEQLRPCTGSETPDTTMCMPFGGGDTLADTVYGDDTNLMNWSLVGGGTNTALTTGQGHVLRHSALVSWP